MWSMRKQQLELKLLFTHPPHDTLPPLRLTRHATGMRAYTQTQEEEEATRLQVCKQTSCVTCRRQDTYKSA